jgi:hypothetical protein
LLTFNKFHLLTVVPFVVSTFTAPSSMCVFLRYSTEPLTRTLLGRTMSATSSSAALTTCAVPSIPSSPCYFNAEFFSDTFSDYLSEILSAFRLSRSVDGDFFGG